MKLQHLSNEDLNAKTKLVAERERHSTIRVLWHLRENERRMLYAQMGYRDLKEYCVKELKYSEGSAWRRINAMRILHELPDVEEKIQNGDLNLSQISLAKTHFRDAKSTRVQKQEILSSLENQSYRKTERILAELKPEMSRPMELERPIKGNKIEVTLVLGEEQIKDLEEIQKLLGKKMSKLELINLMAQQTLKNLKKSTGHRKFERKAQPAPKSRHVPKQVVVEVKNRDQHRCQYVDPISKRQCEAVHDLQIEHRMPFAKGGSSQDVENLELLCANHNKLRAIEQYGHEKMQTYITSLG